MPFSAPAPVIALVQDLYQGTIYSNPVPWPSGALSCTAKGLLSDADALNNANHAGWNLEVSFNNGLSYQHAGGYVWEGGPSHSDPNIPAPPGQGAGYAANDSKPTHVRIRAELPLTLSIGGSISFEG